MLALRNLVIVALFVSPFQRGEAQAGLAQKEIRLSLAAYLHDHFPTVPRLANRPTAVVRERLGTAYDGTLRHGRADSAALDAAELPVLATALGGRVAAKAESQLCIGADCSASGALYVQIGEPTVVGDSANVVYTVSFGAANRKTRVTDIYVGWFVHSAGKWRMTAVSGANGGILTPPHPIANR